MKIIFAGTPEFAAHSLSAIISAGHHVVAAYTQPDRPAGRGKKLLASAVKTTALEHDIPVYQPLNFKDSQSLEELRELAPDLMIVAAYGIILPKDVLEIPTQGCINIHASLLPRWRGAAPIQRAIQAGDKETGITIMQMDEGLDTGDMLLKVSTNIEADDTGGSLHDKLASLGAEAILDYLSRAESLSPEKQDDSFACYASKLTKQEAQLAWNQSAEQLERTVRAFNPWPVAFLQYEGERIRVLEATSIIENHQQPAGTILGKSKEGIQVACAENILNITKLQIPGGKALCVADFVNGGKALLEPGTLLDDTSHA